MDLYEFDEFKRRSMLYSVLTKRIVSLLLPFLFFGHQAIFCKNSFHSMDLYEFDEFKRRSTLYSVLTKRIVSLLLPFFFLGHQAVFFIKILFIRWIYTNLINLNVVQRCIQF